MEGLKLGDLELQYYAELFQTCDVEGTGKITGIKASELFLASGLNQDALKQIWELCGAKRIGHLGRSQFYIALKLIAVAQAGLPIKLETLNAGKDIPLPKFSSKSNDQGDKKRSSAEGDSNIGDGKGQSCALPPPPTAKQSHRRSLSGQYRGVVPDGTASFQQSPQQSTNRDDSPHNAKSPTFSPKQSPPTSPSQGVSRTVIRQHTAPSLYSGTVAKDTVIHDTGHVNPVALASNNVGGGGGPGGGGVPGGGGGIVNSAMTASGGGGPGGPHINPMALQGLGGPYHNSSSENGNWAMFEDDESHMLIGNGIKKWESSLEPPGVDSSSISSEAESVDDVWTITDEQREYYMKQFVSMQPDLNGVITGPVAKNFFEKSKLPVVELSKIWQLSDLNRDGALSVEEFCIAMHLVVLRRNDIELPDHLPVSLMPYSTLSDEPFAADLPPGSTLKRATPPSPLANQWTANFVQESPGSSGVPSPAHLVNFDYAKPSVDADSRIVHPVPLRVSPDGHPLPPEGFDRVPMVSRGQLQPPPLSSQLGEEGGVPGAGDPAAASLPPSQGPPTPPPRPQMHGRSLSVDLKPGAIPASVLPPAVPPRVQPKDVSLTQKSSEPGASAESGVPSVEALDAGMGGSASGAPAEQETAASGDDMVDSVSKDRLTQPFPPAQRQMSRDKRDIGMAIRTHRERNAMLTRLNSELNQELQEVMEQRIALEIQLEHLRPFSS